MNAYLHVAWAEPTCKRALFFFSITHALSTLQIFEENTFLFIYLFSKVFKRKRCIFWGQPWGHWILLQIQESVGEKRFKLKQLKTACFWKGALNLKCWITAATLQVKKALIHLGSTFSLRYSCKAQKGVMYFNKAWRGTTKQQLQLHVLKYDATQLILWAWNPCSPLSWRNHFTALLWWATSSLS